MKLNSSSSISTSTLSGIFPTSKGSVYGCISFVFRRILCSRRTLPTHPFDQFKEIDQKLDSPATPSLVARLMGLDSMPEKSTVKDSPPITRSKSMNLEDCRFEEKGEMQGKHRRVKTSVSFKETPCYFELEDDDFFVIRFESGRRNRRSRVNRAKSKTSGMNTKKKKEKCLVDTKIETESDESANLSPVSVLDSTLFVGDHEELNTTASIEEEETTRKLAYDHNNATCSKEDENEEPNEAVQAGLQREDYHSQQNIEMLKQICKLAESEMAYSQWECRNKVIGNLKVWEVEIGAELGLQILDQLVDEVVDQLF